MEKQLFPSAGSTFESVGINCQETNEQEKSRSKCKKFFYISLFCI